MLYAHAVPGLRQQRNLHQLVDHRLERRPGVEDPAVDDGPVHRVARIEDIAQPRGVPHEIAHGEAPPALDRFDLHGAVAVHAGEDLQIGERGDELRHRIIELPPAFLVQHHQGGADDRLGHREDAEDGVELDRVVLADVELPHRIGEDDLPVPRQHRDDARELPVVHHRLHAGVEPFEAFGGDPDRGRVGDREVARRLCPDRGGRRALKRRRTDDERHQRGEPEQERPPPSQHAIHRVFPPDPRTVPAQGSDRYRVANFGQALAP